MLTDVLEMLQAAEELEAKLREAWRHVQAVAVTMAFGTRASMLNSTLARAARSPDTRIGLMRASN